MSRLPSVKLGVAYLGAVLSVAVVVQLVKFISYLPASATPLPDEPSSQERPSTAWVVLHNVSLICCFLFLHSALADSAVKGFFERWGLRDQQRSIYVIVTCISLQFLLYSWQPTPWFVLWNLNINSNHWLWWMYTILHVYIWILVYAGNLMLDVPELLGIKQVIYSNVELQNPENYKSSSLQRLRKHMNHTSFLGFSILFWVYPLMRLDRVIFAVLLQLYMVINWNPDSQDLKYMKEQFEHKKLEVK
ncbi:hypothetical protein R5R35_007520 [Gryllus longicercus]|uniref:Nuclear envelope membrane protein n=1 Tax=Gryllus longicercus TaxID=2509291 RepID=A0AAN9VAH4_9ORTH